MRKFTIFAAPLLLILLIAVVSGCSQTSYKTIGMDEAKKMIDSHPEMTVLDVRTSAEYAEGHIPNAKLYPVQEIQDKLNELDKNKSYLVVCRSGSRSKAASDILAKNGFKNIYNTSGGMMQWKYELEK